MGKCIGGTKVLGLGLQANRVELSRATASDERRLAHRVYCLKLMKVTQDDVYESSTVSATMLILLSVQGCSGPATVFLCILFL
jgi:hypothetical protein